MTPEAQRIAIAGACGWEMHSIGLMKKGDSWACTQTKAQHSCIPDYLNDLNAMHEAEKSLTEFEKHDYGMKLLDVVEAHGNLANRYNHVTATSVHRAEAFLRVIGKWEDDK